MSHPSRVRGLKLQHLNAARPISAVAPFTGAWIETPEEGGDIELQGVAPFTGAWIETTYHYFQKQ